MTQLVMEQLKFKHYILHTLVQTDITSSSNRGNLKKKPLEVTKNEL